MLPGQKIHQREKALLDVVKRIIKSENPQKESLAVDVATVLISFCNEFFFRHAADAYKVVLPTDRDVYYFARKALSKINLNDLIAVPGSSGVEIQHYISTQLEDMIKKFDQTTDEKEYVRSVRFSPAA